MPTLDKKECPITDIGAEILLNDRRHAWQATADLVANALSSARTLLGMRVAFISEFKEGRRFFLHVNSEEGFSPIQVGQSDPLEESYCQRVVDGRLPEMIRDASQLEEALTIKATTSLPVGAHLSIPIRFSDGYVFGSFCCFSDLPNQTLNERDVMIIRIFAKFAGQLLEREIRMQRHEAEVAARLQSVIDDNAYHIVYQPIFTAADKRIVGYEALSRFSAEPAHPPDRWFRDAADVGMQEELELLVARAALEGLHRMAGDEYVSVNLSPKTLLSQRVFDVFNDYPGRRIVLELTEHNSIENYRAIRQALAPLKGRGVRIAVDDAGAGYATFRHILELEPDLIKLDRSLIENIDSGKANRALAAALLRFSKEMGMKVIAEGVETAGELAVLRSLGVDLIQGFVWGRPMPLGCYAA